jgi:DNA-directed RNA polymerase subunit RPC12/RpoP
MPEATTKPSADTPSAFRHCRTCHGDTALRRLDAISGEDRPLGVTLRGLPVLECGRGHRQFVTPDFALDALNHLTEEDEAQLPAAATRGVLFKHFLCADCGTELEPKPDHAHTFTVELSLPGTPPFQAELRMPVYHCAACSKDQLHSLKEIRDRTPAALARAFKAGGLVSA